MRIAFHGYKGGVGKSTISLMLAKALAENGGNVLFIDRDVMSYASQLSGINSDGIFIQIGMGKNPQDFYKSFKIGKGELKIVKLFSPGIEYYKVMHEFNKFEEFKRFYTDFLKKQSFDYMIIDNPVFLSWEKNPITYETIAFKEVFPNEKSAVVSVTDPTPFSIDDSIIYLRRIASEPPIGWYPLAGIINMAVEEKEKYVEDIRRLMDAIGFPKGVIISFYDEIFQFYGKIDELKVVPEIRKLADKIMSKDTKTKEIIL